MRTCHETNIRYGAMAARPVRSRPRERERERLIAAGFNGPALDVRGTTNDLRVRASTTHISSIEVHEGRWEFCSLPNFRGDCRVLDQGRYAALPQVLNHRIESIRPVDRVVYRERRGPDYSSLELYSAPGFRGSSISVDRNMWNLDRRGAGDNVSSLIVREGTWELCTEPGFNGTCRTFGPGEYPRLGRRMDDNVSSLRRVG
jgi:hypothetical protein